MLKFVLQKILQKKEFLIFYKKKILELFCGSGNISYEFASRGVKFILMRSFSWERGLLNING